MKLFKHETDLLPPISFVLERDEGLTLIVPRNVAKILRLKAGDSFEWVSYDESSGEILLKIQRK